jgi:hypothetical protein
MNKIDQSRPDVQNTSSAVPPGAPQSGPARDGSPAPAGAPAAVHGVRYLMLDVGEPGQPDEVTADVRLLLRRPEDGYTMLATVQDGAGEALCMALLLADGTGHLFGVEDDTIRAPIRHWRIADGEVQ